MADDAPDDAPDAALCVAVGRSWRGGKLFFLRAVAKANFLVTAEGPRDPLRQSLKQRSEEEEEEEE
eukprot:6726203-Prymnesium_polylepis.1